jgi:hypothetical protein
MVGKHESMFPTIAFIARQILDIVGSQKQIERIFSLVGIFTNLSKCQMQSNNSIKLVFVSKNWPNGF